MNLLLRRLTSDAERTTGTLEVAGHTFATIERPWIAHPEGPGGMPRQSCVPPGRYQVQPWNSANFPHTYIIVNNANGVYLQSGLIPPGQKWGRAAILIHCANRVRDVVGCIGLGMGHGEIQGEPAVLRSVMAMRELDKILDRGVHRLEIQ